jgi:hypothetical protein
MWVSWGRREIKAPMIGDGVAAGIRKIWSK